MLWALVFDRGRQNGIHGRFLTGFRRGRRRVPDCCGRVGRHQCGGSNKTVVSRDREGTMDPSGRRRRRRCRIAGFFEHRHRERDERKPVRLCGEGAEEAGATGHPRGSCINHVPGSFREIGRVPSYRLGSRRRK